MEKEREIIYLAALLHDIGKFYQRADEGLYSKQAQISEYSKRLANDICPVNDAGKFGYQHVIWTNEFFEQVNQKLSLVPGLKENLYETASENCLVNLTCNHHQPKTEIQAIVTMADWWSAGIDRREAIEKEEADDKLTQINWGKTRYKNIPLFSIFNTIKNGNGRYAFPLKSIDISNKTFPKFIKTKDDGVNQEEYKTL